MDVPQKLTEEVDRNNLNLGRLEMLLKSDRRIGSMATRKTSKPRTMNESLRRNLCENAKVLATSTNTQLG